MKILRVIYYIFLVCIAGIAVLLVVSVLPVTGNYKFLVVQSGSMEPTIKTGSVVMVKPASDYKIGDIVTFGQTTKTKTPTTHRISDIQVQAGEPLYTTKGDANNAPDTKTISKKDIIGKVLIDVPYAGYAVATARKPWGFALIIIVPAAIIIFDEVKKIYKEFSKLKQQDGAKA